MLCGQLYSEVALLSLQAKGSFLQKPQPGPLYSSFLPTLGIGTAAALPLQPTTLTAAFADHLAVQASR